MRANRASIPVLILFALVACRAPAPGPTTPPALTPLPITATTAKPNAPILFASGQVKTWSVAVDDSSVYWTDCGDNPAAQNGKVLRAPKTGGAPIALAAGESCPTTLTVDADSVYYLANDPGKS